MMLIICRQIVSGLVVLHENNIIHHNIKLENVLTFQYETGDKTFKLADYGAFGKLDTEILIKPIECLQGQYDTTKGDVWQLGILFYQIMKFSNPFSGKNEA